MKTRIEEWLEVLTTAGERIKTVDPEDTFALEHIIAGVGLYYDGRPMYGVWQAFTAPNFAPGLWQNPSELADLMVFCRTHEITSVLEVGTFYGGTAVLLLAYLRHHVSIYSLLTTVDTEQRLPLYFYGLACVTGTSEGFKYGIAHDLVLIDADHHYAAALKDYENLNGSRFVAFHDVVDKAVGSYPCGGVPRLWKELSATHKTTVISHSDEWMGWGILHPKEERA